MVVLVFLANHCPAVQACDDRIIDFANDYKDKSVKLVAVSVNDIDQDRLPGIKEHMKEKSINYAYGYDETPGDRPGLRCRRNTPHFFVLDKEREHPLHRRDGRQRHERGQGHQALPPRRRRRPARRQDPGRRGDPSPRAAASSTRSN